MNSYAEFLDSKRQQAAELGINVKGSKVVASNRMFKFQLDVVKWALRKGRSAIFAGTGLGKSLMALSWAETLVKQRDCLVLIVAPLAVAHQFKSEGRKFDISVNISNSQSNVKKGINITNYEKLHKFDVPAFDAVVLDESSILKSYTGRIRTDIIEACKYTPYRLACTATPSPNDYMELGNHAEFVGIASYTDMLSTFFVHDGGSTQSWRLKGHAEDDFWKWVSSWAVMFNHPRDIGYDECAFDLPELREHYFKAEMPIINGSGFFPDRSPDLRSRIIARRNSVSERVALAADITSKDEPFVWWCNLNAESSLLAASIDDAVELTGSDSADDKLYKLTSFAKGDIRVLVTKPSICGYGLNWQHCSHTGFVGLTDSFEQVYQAIRRIWRFGQIKTVDVYYITAETEGAVLMNIKRKQEDAEKMRKSMLCNMTSLTRSSINSTKKVKTVDDDDVNFDIPGWL